MWVFTGQNSRDLSHARVFLTVLSDFLDINFTISRLVEDCLQASKVCHFGGGHLGVMEAREEGKVWPKAGKGGKRPRWSDLEPIFLKRWGESTREVAEPQVNFTAEVLRGLKSLKK